MVEKVLIIGGNSDIGKDLIQNISNDFDIVYTYRGNKIEIADTKRISAIKLDLSSLDAVLDFCDYIVHNKFRHIVYCAGHNMSKLINQLSYKDITDDFTVNCLSPIHVFRAFCQTIHDKEFKSIVFVSSIAATKVKEGNAAYGSAKIATERFLANCALEFARWNLRTLSVSPAYIDSNMLRNYIKNHQINMTDILKNIPSRKMLSTKEVANVITSFIMQNIPTTGVSISLGNGEKLFY